MHFFHRLSRVIYTQPSLSLTTIFWPIKKRKKNPSLLVTIVKLEEILHIWRLPLCKQKKEEKKKKFTVVSIMMCKFHIKNKKNNDAKQAIINS